MKKVNIVLLLAFNLVSIGCAFAQQGTLDSTFNGNGKRFLTPSNSHENAYSMVVQPDSNIVIAGLATMIPANSFDLCVARIHADGSIDSTFGTNGYVTYDNATRSDYGYDVDLQTDGKIVVTGAVSITAANTAFFAMRLNADGSYDTTFANQGKFAYDYSSGEEYAQEGVIQPDGKIVLGGYSITGSTYNIQMMRLNTDGTLDSTFGLGGVALPNYNIGSARLLGLALKANGSFVGVGYKNSSSGNNGQAFGVLADGSIDSVFGTDGIIALAMSNANAVKVHNTNIYVCGYIAASTNTGVVYALNDTGLYLLSFGIGGKTTVSLNSGVVYNDLRVQTDGKIVVAGGTTVAAFSSDFMVSRFNTNGNLDSSFATNGNFTVDLGVQTSENALGMTIQPDGKILACGVSMQTTNNDMAIIRLKASSSNVSVFELNSNVSPLSVYPNPIEDYFTVDIPSTEKINKVELMSVNGAIIEITITNSNKFKVPQQLSNGIYILKVYTNNQVYSSKLIK